MVIDKFSRSYSVISIANDQVRHPSVKLDGLWYLSQLHQLRKVIDLGPNSEVIISQLMRSRLQVFAPRANVFGNLVVLLRERAHLVAKLSCLSSAFDFDFTSNRAELINVARSNLLLNREQLQIELLLVGLLQESHEELAGLEHLRAQHRIKEALIVRLALGKLAWVLFLELCGGQGRDDYLRVRAQQEITQYLEVRIESFNAPLHGECVNGDHHALILGQACILGCDVLIDASDDACRAHITAKNGFLGCASVLAPHDRA